MNATSFARLTLYCTAVVLVVSTLAAPYPAPLLGCALLAGLVSATLASQALAAARMYGWPWRAEGWRVLGWVVRRSLTERIS